MHGAGDEAVFEGLCAVGELAGKGREATGAIGRVSARDDEAGAAASPFGEVGGELAVVPERVLEAGVHGAHEHAVLERKESKVEGGEQVRIRVGHVTLRRYGSCRALAVWWAPAIPQAMVWRPSMASFIDGRNLRRRTGPADRAVWRRATDARRTGGLWASSTDPAEVRSGQRGPKVRTEYRGNNANRGGNPFDDSPKKVSLR